MNNLYLIPANSKKSQLIFSIFTWFDLVMFGIGILITLIMLFVVRSNNPVVMIINILPAAITGILVMPIPNYHNVMGFFKSMINFVSNRKQYYWRGWCMKDVYGRDFENRIK